ncbi:MAG: sigma factor [Spirochaeta sp.]|jgi:DNA-directed RNA polymerase specialized sigma24 family protein|nr:sigma factor [Spirochaeta sp.]
MISINYSYAQFISGTITYDTLIIHCCRYVRDAMARLFGIPGDDRDDAVADFFPRLALLIHRYRDQGASFEAYLMVSLRFFCRTRHRQRERLETVEMLVPDVEDASYTADAPRPIVATYSIPEEDPTVIAENPEVPFLTNTRTKDTVRRQMLISFCKNLPLLDDEDVAAFATTLKIPGSLLDALQTYVNNRRDRFVPQQSGYRRQRDRHYTRMRALEVHLAPGSTSEAKYQVSRRYRFHRRLWHYYCRRLKRQKISLSNAELSVLLGIPKGSVDTSLVRLNRRLEIIQNARYATKHGTCDYPGVKQRPQISGNDRHPGRPGRAGSAPPTKRP